VINTSNLTSKNKPPWLLAELVGPARTPRPTPSPGPLRAAALADTWTFGARFRRVLGRAVHAVALAGQIPLSWLAAIPRRLGDRLFAMNDAEAYWCSWQITRTHGGLGRRYRDPQFGTLAECPKCQGAGVAANLPCPPCLGTGRVTLGEVS
jgi:hypothetical protein